MLNLGLAPIASGAAAGRFLVILFCSVSVFLRSGALSGRLHAWKTTVLTILLGLFLVVHSMYVSPLVDVSIAKALLWTMATSTILAAWQSLNAEDRRKLALEIFTGLTMLMLASLPLLFTPVGFLRNGTGFQGLLNHPQAFGPTMALLGAWAAGRVMEDSSVTWRMASLLLICLVLIIASEARTAGFALVIGAICAFMLLPVFGRRGASVSMRGLKSARFKVLAIGSLIGIVLAWSLLESTLTSYVQKGTDAGGLTEAYEKSRGGGIEEMWLSIQANPLLGIGFGVAPDLNRMEVVREPYLGLPISAAIEKGVLPLAILEELGVVGFVLVAIWVYALVQSCAQSGIAGMVVLMTLFFLNFGECTLFSAGGFGLLPLILVGWAASKRQIDRSYS